MIEKEINSAFKLKEDYTQILPSKKELSKIIRDTVRDSRKKEKRGKRIVTTSDSVSHPKKVSPHHVPGEILTKKDEKAGHCWSKVPENLKKRGVAGGENLNVI